MPLDISKKNLVLSSNFISSKLFTNFKFVFFPLIFSPSSKIFFSPITPILASSVIFSFNNFDVNSGPMPEGSPNKIAIFFYYS